MEQKEIPTRKYDGIIKKMRLKKGIIIASAIIAVLAVLVFCTPSYVGFMGKTIIENKGLNPVIIVLLFILIYFLECFAYAIVLLPLTTSLNVECDPQKYLALNSAFGKRKNKYAAYVQGYFYMGDFSKTLDYAGQMIASGKPKQVIAGFFYKARCEFFLGNTEALKITAKQLYAAVSNTKNVNDKTRAAYNEWLKNINLLCALADKDIDKINEYRNSIKAWGNFKITEGYVNYLKGVSAYYADDKEECVYRLKSVKDSCEKTVFARLANEYLEMIKI